MTQKDINTCSIRQGGRHKLRLGMNMQGGGLPHASIGKGGTV